MTLTIGAGGAIGSMWPSYEGDWQTPPLPNGKIINNGTVIVENGGATEADFDTNNGDILVKDGGCAVCCNVNNGTVVVEDGGEYATTQGSTATNNGTVVIHQGATMRSRFGTKIINSAQGTINLNGWFYCGCIGDGMWFENQGTVTGNGDVILYEAAHDMMPVNDMDALIADVMAQLGQSTRYDNWDDVFIFRLLEASDYAALKAAVPGNRVVAGEEVPGDMDTLIEITGNIEIPAGERIGTMARLGVPEEVTITVNDGATLSCGMENYGTVNVLPGGSFSTTQGGRIENHGSIIVSQGAVMKSQMGGEIVNLSGATLTIDGTCYCGCIGFGGYDGCWFENHGTVTGGGSIVLYEPAHDEMPVSDLKALVATVAAQIAGGETVPTVTTQGGHTYAKQVIMPKAAALGYTIYTCACGDSYIGTYTAPTGKLTLKCAARTATAEKVQWNYVKTATGYQVQISTKDGKAWATAVNMKAGVTSYTFKNLVAGGNYKFRVRFYIKAADGKNYFSPWQAISSPTLPKATNLAVSAAKKAFTAKWTKVAGVTGYQVQYSTNAKFTGAKTVTIKGAAKYTQAVKNLKGGARYYVRIRTYQAIGGAYYYSTWSATKAVTTKK